jgi:hypothetical protein
MVGSLLAGAEVDTALETLHLESASINRKQQQNILTGTYSIWNFVRFLFRQLPWFPSSTCLNVWQEAIRVLSSRPWSVWNTHSFQTYSLPVQIPYWRRCWFIAERRLAVLPSILRGPFIALVRILSFMVACIHPLYLCLTTPLSLLPIFPSTPYHITTTYNSIVFRTWSFPFISFAIHYSVIILSFDAIDLIYWQRR